MSRLRTLSLFVALIAGFTAQHAFAAQRTFVASTGNDGNPCSLAQPCRSFSAAIAQTNAGGDVVVLDSAGYGGVTITQSVNIISPPGVYAGVTVTTGSAIIVNGPGITVSLKGLTINGAIQAGIDYADGAELVVESCTISNFATGINADAPNGRLIVRNTTIAGSSLRSMRLKGANVAPIHATIEGAELRGSGGYGIYILGAVQATIRDSVVTRNVDQAIYVTPDLALLANKVVVEVMRSVLTESRTGLEIDVGINNATMELSIEGADIGMNSEEGIRSTVSSASSAVRLSIADAHVHHNTLNGIVIQNTSGGISEAVLTRNIVTRNGNAGIVNVGSNSAVRSAGDNRVDSNDGTEVSGTITTFGGV